MHNKNKKGFSLMEVIIAIFVITIGITGAMSLITYSISNVAISKSKIIAVSLAQEGIEVVRNIRDTNWIEDVDWNDGLDPAVDCPGGCRIQYSSLSLMSLSSNPALKIDGNSFYQYDVGADTRFHRKIEITNISANEIKVVSEVTWNERGRSPEVIAETRLYNWK